MGTISCKLIHGANIQKESSKHFFCLVTQEGEENKFIKVTQPVPGYLHPYQIQETMGRSFLMKDCPL
ncbi:unnamed protein product [Acanthoscelides obtectus]|uniref:Uncharacterized protein n=1 Tax=Acanthoscelides obtectus TaxID=200917 RepID=A0A9P0L4Q0_ACAOB|nr:unnamed protein product [Acanthoscelides obtectus]CAK1651695.1 hypothetical protein AOBTE_LOCUS17395 [Acanthoscelides obtectus]